MTPIASFEAVWNRCAHLSAMHAYLAANVTPALRPDEVLRAEWAARVSALDLYIHELVAQRMLEIFEKARPACPGFLKFKISTETMQRIGAAATPSDAASAFDLEVRDQLSHRTFQDPDDIADGVRCCSAVELWNEVAIHGGASQQTKVRVAKSLKRDLSVIVKRRHQIVHEGDLQPTSPRVPWPISQGDLTRVSEVIERTVRAIDAVA